MDQTGILTTGDINQEISLHDKALNLVEGFTAERTRARDMLLLSQVFQKRAYNKGRLNLEFEEGDEVVINRKNLGLLRDEKGRGDKLLARYKGPFEIIKRISAVAYEVFTLPHMF